MDSYEECARTARVDYHVEEPEATLRSTDEATTFAGQPAEASTGRRSQPAATAGIHGQVEEQRGNRQRSPHLSCAVNSNSEKQKPAKTRKE